MANRDKLLEPLHREAWYVFELLGRAAYADSGLCLIGEPPSTNTCDLAAGNAAKLQRAIARGTKAMAIKMMGEEHTYFDGLDLPVDTRYYRHVFSEYPKATFHRPKRGDPTKPITIKSDGEIVGALMCMKTYG